MKPNPWTGINAWKEFVHDVHHPREAFGRAWAGAMGRNPLITSEERWIGLALVTIGLAQVCLGVVCIVVGLMR